MLFVVDHCNYFLGILLSALIAIWLRQIVLPPSDFPKSIPTIPFYVCFLPIIFNWDQKSIYEKHFREKVENYGAVKVYFASRWNILVTKPEYVKTVISHNDIFEKSGNQEKIPHAVIAEYLGDNLISAGNENWAKYRSLTEDSIRFPDMSPLEKNAELLLQEISNSLPANKTMKVNDIFQKYTLSCVGDCIIGSDLRTPLNGVSIQERINYLKNQIFKPLFMNFTFLDKLPIPSRIRARNAVREFKKLFFDKILADKTVENSNKLGPSLADGFEKKIITKQQFQDNAMIAMVAGHENPQILLTTVIYLLSKHPSIQDELRCLLNQNTNHSENPFLDAIVYEALRLLPPIAQLINRVTRQRVFLEKDLVIPKGVYIGNNSLFTQRDEKYWKDADEFRPQRWGTTKEEINKRFRLAQSNCTLTAFHGRKRSCLGQLFALAEVKIAVVAIVKVYKLSLDPTWIERFTPSGPLVPVNLSVHFEEVQTHGELY